MFVRLTRILFLDSRGIGQDEAAQVHRPRGTEDPAGEASGDEPRQIADVIQVRVRQDDGVDRSGLDRERFPVTLAKLFQPLEKTTVHQYA